MGECVDDMGMDTGCGEWGEEERFDEGDLHENEPVQDAGQGSHEAHRPAHRKSILGEKSGVPQPRRSQNS